MSTKQFTKRPKAIALVVVSGGVAEAYAPEHVDVRVIDFDNLDGLKPVLPKDMGFEELCTHAGLTKKDVRFE